MNTIGERIRYARKMKNLTISALNKLTGLSVGNLSDLENNKSMPSSNALIKLREVLGVSIDWLLTGQESTYMCKENEAEYLLNNSKDLIEITEKEKFIFKAFKKLPDERKRDIEGYIKVSLNSSDLEQYIKNNNKI